MHLETDTICVDGEIAVSFVAKAMITANFQWCVMVIGLPERP